MWIEAIPSANRQANADLVDRGMENSFWMM